MLIISIGIVTVSSFKHRTKGSLLSNWTHRQKMDIIRPQIFGSSFRNNVDIDISKVSKIQAFIHKCVYSIGFIFSPTSAKRKDVDENSSVDLKSSVMRHQALSSYPSYHRNYRSSSFQHLSAALIVPSSIINEYLSSIASLLSMTLPLMSVMMLYFAVILFLTHFLADGIFRSSFSSRPKTTASPATVVKLQIGLTADWSEEQNIMNTLSEIVTRKSSSASKKVSDAVVALLRRQSDWNSATMDCQISGTVSQAELEYYQLFVSEKIKLLHSSDDSSNVALVVTNSAPTKAQKPEVEVMWWDKKLSKSPDMAQQEQEQVEPSPDAIVGPTKTQAVVSLLAVIRGRSGTYRGLTGIKLIDGVLSFLFGRWRWRWWINNGRSSLYDVMRNCLLRLATEALVNDGNDILRAEVMYSPSAVGKILSMNETLVAYPELVKI